MLYLISNFHTHSVMYTQLWFIGFLLLCRAEQSEVLTEDVQSAERHVELLKLTCGTISKKITAFLSSMHLSKTIPKGDSAFLTPFISQEMKERSWTKG